MMSLMKKAALLLSISIAVVILLLASNGFFNHNDAVENLRHHVHRTPQGSIDQTTLTSLMDAHPHMVIANEFALFRNWKYYSDRQKDLGEDNPFFKHKSYLFNILYRQSYYDTLDGFRSEQNTKKNYTLSTDSLMAGKIQ